MMNHIRVTLTETKDPIYYLSCDTSTGNDDYLLPPAAPRCHVGPLTFVGELCGRLPEQLHQPPFLSRRVRQLLAVLQRLHSRRALGLLGSAPPFTHRTPSTNQITQSTGGHFTMQVEFSLKKKRKDKSPFKGDLEISEETGDVIAAGFSAVPSFSFFSSSSSRPAARGAFAFPLTT